MGLEHYLESVTEQIRCKKARDFVSAELENHILEQAEAYEAEGISKEEALEKAVKEMGDPIEVGISLDRIHKPKISWELLLLVGIISILGICIHAVFGAGKVYVKKYVMQVIIGYACMFLVYRMDYSFLEKWGKKLAFYFLAFTFIGYQFFSIDINGASYYLCLGSIHFSKSMFMYLYIPLFAGVLYAYRGKSYVALGKIFLWTVIPVYLQMTIPSISSALVLALCLFGMFLLAVWKGWYKINKKITFGVCGVGILSLPFWGFLLYFNDKLRTYQVERLRAFFTGESMSYWEDIMQHLLQGSSLFSGVGIEQEVLDRNLGAINSDYIFIYVIGTYGILVALFLVGIVAILTIRIFKISLGQKNQFGQLLGFGCGLFFLFQIGLHLAVNLGFFPLTASVLPFFSAGGCQILISYILLGLVLSIYRYKNILKPERRISASNMWSMKE